MSHRLKQILDTYEDFELAFLYKYNLKTYLKETEAFVKNYIQKRGLTDDKIQQLIDETSKIAIDSNTNKCARCKSSKIINLNEELINTSFDRNSSGYVQALDGAVGRAVFTEKKICSVCGFVIQDFNESNNNLPWYKRFLDNLINSLAGMFRR